MPIVSAANADRSRIGICPISGHIRRASSRVCRRRHRPDIQPSYRRRSRQIFIGNQSAVLRVVKQTRGLGGRGAAMMDLVIRISLTVLDPAGADEDVHRSARRPGTGPASRNAGETGIYINGTSTEGVRATNTATPNVAGTLPAAAGDGNEDRDVIASLPTPRRETHLARSRDQVTTYA